MADIFFCFNCMSLLEDSTGICPVCNGDTGAQNKNHQLPAGTILNGRYLVGLAIGEGGFGITYIGYDLKLNAKVAIKEYFLSGGVSRTSSETIMPVNSKTEAPFIKGREKFIEEAKMLAQFMDEPNIVSVWDYFSQNNTGYIVMEYLQGTDMNRWLKENGPQSFETVYDMLAPVLRALDRVHKKGLIHRDISPANLMLLNDGRVKLLDFGAAREQSIGGERSLSVLLKPGYAPEEQYRTHGQQGPWTDVYALCASIYKLICGNTPVPSTDRVINDTIILPSAHGAKISPEHESVLMKGLAVKAEDRYQSIEELCAAFDLGKKVAPVRKKKKNGKKIAAIAAAGIMACAALAFVIFGQKDVGGNSDAETSETKQAEVIEEPVYVSTEQYLAVSEKWYTVDGKISEENVFNYNEYGSEVYEKHCTYSAYEDYSEYLTFTEFINEFDSRGSIKKVIYTDLLDSKYSNVTEYDWENDKSFVYYSDGTLKSYRERIYEENNIYIEYEYYPDGTMISFRRSDNSGIEDGFGIRKFEIFNPDGSLQSTSVTEIIPDGEGRQEIYSFTNETSDYSYINVSQFDKNDNLTYYKQETFGYGVNRTEEFYEYDSENRIIKAKRTTYDDYSGLTEYSGVFEYELFEVLERQN